MRRLGLLAAALLPAACARTTGAPPEPPRTDAALAALSDEFDRPQTLGDWRPLFRDEGGADQLARRDVGGGWLTLVPHTSTWYQNYRGVLLYKPVQGDFVVTTRVRVSRRGGGGAPRSQFSLAGLMVRAPRAAGLSGENYVFLSLGAADSPGRFQLEVKTTVRSDSQLQITPAPSGEARIQVARLGTLLVMLVDDGGGWRVHRRYDRADLPETLQVGMTCYTDWPGANRLPPERHNATVIPDGNPDLDAAFDYVRFRRPKRLTDPRAASDRELLSFLGEAAAG